MLFWTGGTGSRGNDFSCFCQDSFKVSNGLFQTVLDLDLGFPIQFSFRCGNIWFALGGVVLRFGQKLDFRLTVGQVLNVFGKVFDGILIGISQIDWQVVLAIHEGIETVHQVADILKGSCLGAISVNGEVLVLQGLNDEVGDDPAVIGVHAGPKGVENARHANVDRVLVPVAIHHGLGHALSLVVAGAGSNGVDVAPVALWLWVYLGISVDLRGGSEQHARLDPLGQAQHVNRAHGGGLDGLDWVVLVVRRRGGTGQVVDLVHLQHHGLNDVVHHKRKVGMVQPVLNVALLAREKVVHHHHLVAQTHELVHQVRPHEPRTTRHEDLQPLGIRHHRRPDHVWSGGGGHRLRRQERRVFLDALRCCRIRRSAMYINAIPMPGWLVHTSLMHGGILSQGILRERNQKRGQYGRPHHQAHKQHDPQLRIPQRPKHPGWLFRKWIVRRSSIVIRVMWYRCRHHGSTRQSCHRPNCNIIVAILIIVLFYR
mmetsp:Transcript_17664/g.31903  ORF Transcript_17664/g.31903 Transcript_17664/m.31903 type:complete len:484 (-) Transcript_17664:26-1477(-)